MSPVENSQPVAGVPALLFVQHDAEIVVKYSEINNEKYNKTSNSFERVNKRQMGRHTFFGAVMHKNKVFVLAARWLQCKSQDVEICKSHRIGQLQMES